MKVRKAISALRCLGVAVTAVLAVAVLPSAHGKSPKEVFADPKAPPALMVGQTSRF